MPVNVLVVCNIVPLDGSFGAGINNCNFKSFNCLRIRIARHDGTYFNRVIFNCFTVACLYGEVTPCDCENVRVKISSIQQGPCVLNVYVAVSIGLTPSESSNLFQSSLKNVILVIWQFARLHFSAIAGVICYRQEKVRLGSHSRVGSKSC